MANWWDEGVTARPASGAWWEEGVQRIAPPAGKQAKDLGDAILAGLQNSATGLALRGKMPDQVLGEDSPWYHRLAAGAAGVAADVPISVAAAIPAAPTGPIGVAAAAFGAPMALREALIEAYNGNHATSWEGVWEIGKAAATGGAKGAVIGAVTAGAGRVVAPLVQGAGKVAAGVATTGAELATLTGTAAALEGKMPTWQDFMDNALLLGGMKVAMGTARGLRNIYAETGRTPEQVVADAQKNPKLKDALVEGDGKTWTATDAERNGYTIKAYRGVDANKPFNDTGTAWFSTSKEVAEAYAREVWGYENPAVIEVRINPKGLTQYDMRKLSVAEQVALGGDGDTRAPQALGIYRNADDAPIQVRHTTLHVPGENVWIPGQGRLVPDTPPAYAPLALDQRIKAAIDVDPRPEMIRRNLMNDGKPPKLGEVPIADPVKYEYITDLDTAKGVLRAVTDMYQTEITQQTRGVVSNKATAVEALRMIHNGEIGKHVIGEAANNAEIWGRAHLLKGATNHAFRELEALARIPEAELTPTAKLQALAALERVAMLKAELEGVGAEAGRALQIFRAVKRDPTYLGDANMLLAAAERKGNLQDIAKLAASLKDPAQVAEFARRYTKATTMQQVLEGWKAAILSGPQTHLANILGNTVKWLVEVPESVVTATIEAAQRAAKGDPLTMAQWKARAFAPIYGLQHGTVEALHVAAQVWKGQGEKLEKADIYQPAIPGKAGEIIRTPFKALQVVDVFFRTVAERGEAHRLAVDRAVKEGLHPSTAEFRKRVVQLTERPDLGLSEKAGIEVINKIQNVGAEAVFAQRLGPFMETVQGAIARHAPAVQFVVPFVRTPVNLVSWAMQHATVGGVGFNLLSSRWRADFAAGGPQRARALARVVVGTGMTLTAYSMAQEGLLTGGGLFDKEQRATKTAAGWQPYSIKVGDTYYSYQRLEPVAKVLGIAADLIEMLESKKLDEADGFKAASMLVLLFGNATVSTTYLSGISNVIQGTVDPDRYGEAIVEQYASSLVPKIIGQTTMLADPHQREVDGALDAIQAQIPFLREKLLPKRDVWGEPVKGDRLFGVMPLAAREISTEKVRTEAMRLSVAISDVPDFVHEKGPFNPRDKRTELTGPQLDIFREVSGKTAMELLGPIVNAPDWERIPDFAKAAIYKDILRGARKQGEYAALPPDAEARQKLREKILQRILKEQQEADSK